MTGADLFSPFRLGPLTLPNRVVMAPMTRNRAGPGNVPGPLAATYYAQRSSAGLIVSEATQVSPQGVGYPGTPGIHSEAQVAGCAHTQQTENLLSPAGFRTVIATTPQQRQHLKTIPPYKVIRVYRNGKTHYVYADPAHNLIYVGRRYNVTEQLRARTAQPL